MAMNGNTTHQTPANDNFADAAVITGVSGQAAASNVGATKEPGEPDHAGCSGGNSVWWTWTAPETGYFSFDTHGSSFDTLLGVYAGSDIENLTVVADSDDDGSGNGNSGLMFQAESGVRYYIAVDGWSSGDIVLNWRPAEPPENDNFADAITLTGMSGQAAGSNNLFNLPHCLLVANPYTFSTFAQFFILRVVCRYLLKV